jgi:hypothetical protein
MWTGLFHCCVTEESRYVTLCDIYECFRTFLHVRQIHEFHMCAMAWVVLFVTANNRTYSVFVHISIYTGCVRDRHKCFHVSIIQWSLMRTVLLWVTEKSTDLGRKHKIKRLSNSHMQKVTALQHNVFLS